MGFFDLFRSTEKRSSEVEVDAGLLAAMLNQEAVTAEEAMSIPAVAGCVGYICNALCSVPVKMYRTKDGITTEVKDDYRLRLVNAETGDLLSAKEWKEAIIRDYLVQGNGYTYVAHRGNKVSGLYYVKTENVSYKSATDPIYKAAEFYIGGNRISDYELARILRHTRDGISGSGIIAENPKLLNVMKAALSYEFRTFKTGSKRGFLKAQEKLSQDAINALKQGWRNLYSSDSEESVVILNRGLEFQDASQNAVDSQLQSIFSQNSSEICKIFGLSPKLLEGGATENDLKMSIQYGIAPIADAFSAMLNRFLLLEREKNELEFELDLDALDCTSILTRYQAYQVAVSNGWMSLDEVRSEEGLNPMGLEFLKLGLDSVLYNPSDKSVYTANTGLTVSLDDAMATNSTTGEEVKKEDGNQNQKREG